MRVVGIQALLDEITENTTTGRAKGDAFEQLIKAYLTHDLAWSERFGDVWLWSDWPGRDGKTDTGIDLVAQDKDTGDLWAIQCKAYASTHTLQKADIDSFFTASGKSGFAGRIIVSTTDHWSKHAEDALNNQQVPVTRLRVQDLDDSSIDWAVYSLLNPEVTELRAKKQPRPHQELAIGRVIAGFQSSDRGKMIMACGTGKTFTSLQIAERVAGAGGQVLFLVPSISLLQQSLREWTNESSIPLRSYAVCSDTKIGKNAEDISAHDLMYPATTDATKLKTGVAAPHDGKAMTVVFSTYQSIQVISDAQALGLPEFDLIICDEAHRTTGVTLADDDESNFVRVHDPKFIAARKRLYMTATPRIYDDGSKSQAKEAEAVLCSMDDEKIFGPEFHRLGFGEAVNAGLLSDYKVLVLAVDEKYVSRVFQSQLADEDHELKLDDAAKIIGCWNGLAKRRMLQLDDDGNVIENPEDIQDSAPMRRAVAFARSIKDSERIADMFSRLVDQYTAMSDEEGLLRCQVQHVDGTFNVLERSSRLDWLKAETEAGVDTCRILTNARCLSEGVDVPALDAVIFLNPRNSTVDVVQSVGRVMRKHVDKKYGYVILPIGIPSDMKPEEALADNNKYKVVWQVLQALRAHDDRFNAMVNKIELNRAEADMLQVIGVSGGEVDEYGNPTFDSKGKQLVMAFPQIDEWREAIYAKIVQKVGDRRYWEDWAHDIAVIAERHVTRITALLEDPNTRAAAEFAGFWDGLRNNLNEGVTRADAIDMLAQHLITKPVFDALFEDYSFASNNPVSKVMQDMLSALDEHNIDREAETLDKFYESVRLRAAGIDNAEGKQRIITELYEKFFKAAFPRVAEKLGIVYTPIEVVDYILGSVQDVLRDEFASSLSDEGVHVLDPFTGTGTFIARLIESGLIEPAALAHKYRKELHANEIVLLAYYIAAINIEATFHGVHGGAYEPFDGIVLTDTFQMFEHGDAMDEAVFVTNNARVAAQKVAPIRVILGNPPYSVGQGSQNENNRNLSYPTLDSRIRGTYVKEASGANLNSLYDSYIRAFRWASDRIGDQGVIAYVTNGSWLDNSAMDGFRKTLDAEFTAIWVFNLRGNQRTSGETSRKEGGKVFGSGSRTPVSITILVKNPGRTGRCQIHYRDIGDYLTREDKLATLAQERSITGTTWTLITPDAAGDWVNLRDDTFGTYTPLGDKKDKAAKPIFDTYSMGIKTARDAWAINSCRDQLLANIGRMINYYNEQRPALGAFAADKGQHRDDATTELFVATVSDPRKISWTRALKADLRKDKPADLDPAKAVVTMYRPYFKQWLYFDRMMNTDVALIPKLFPTPAHPNLVIGIEGTGSSRGFSCIVSNVIPDLQLLFNGQAFPLYVYDQSDAAEGMLDLGGAEGGYQRRDAITDHTLTNYHNSYGSDLTKEDIFYFVYGLLHSREYVEKFSSDLSKMIPRIPLVKDFWGFSKAGRELAKWHLAYETIDPWPVAGLPATGAPPSSLLVKKMKFAKAGKAVDKSAIIMNSQVTLHDLPLEAYDYTVNGKSAIEWLIDRYQVKTEKDSGILNDPNLWSPDPRYIIDLVARMVRVSIESVRITGALPKLDIIG